MSYAIKKVVDQLVRDLKNRPEDFTCNEYTLVDSRTSYEYWVANGRGHGGIYKPFFLKFGFYGSRRFHRTLDEWKAAAMLSATQGAP